MKESGPTIEVQLIQNGSFEVTSSYAFSTCYLPSD